MASLVSSSLVCETQISAAGVSVLWEFSSVRSGLDPYKDEKKVSRSYLRMVCGKMIRLS